MANIFSLYSLIYILWVFLSVLFIYGILYILLCNLLFFPHSPIYHLPFFFSLFPGLFFVILYYKLFSILGWDINQIVSLPVVGYLCIWPSLVNYLWHRHRDLPCIRAAVLTLPHSYSISCRTWNSFRFVFLIHTHTHTHTQNCRQLPYKFNTCLKEKNDRGNSVSVLYLGVDIDMPSSVSLEF